MIYFIIIVLAVALVYFWLKCQKLQEAVGQFQLKEREFMLTLRAQVLTVDGQTGQRIGSAKNPMMLDHIQKLNGKGARKNGQFIRLQQDRHRMPLSGPPAHRHRHQFQRVQADVLQNNQHVDIRMPGVKLAARQRPVDQEALQLGPQRQRQTTDELAEILFRIF